MKVNATKRDTIACTLEKVEFAGGIFTRYWIERLITSDTDKLKARLRVVISNSQSIKESDNYLDSPVGEKKKWS